LNHISTRRLDARPLVKFADPDWTASGERRASVALERIETLWINTGTLCNITCRNCYIESSPRNDRLEYITAAEVAAYLDEIAHAKLGTREIGFTGGEPFLNPDATSMIGDALARGFEALVLTNAMQPMQRPKVKAALLRLREVHGNRLQIRVSLDHHGKLLHESERGPRTWKPALAGLDWLAQNGFRIAIAGRTCWNESEMEARSGYRRLITEHGWPIDADDPASVVLFPEMDGRHDVPEITTRCWDLLGKSPSEMMCATSRMIIKRKGAASPTVVPCTLLPYEPQFEMATTLTQSLSAHGGMFDRGAVKLCHAHCATFCVLGGGACSA